MSCHEARPFFSVIVPIYNVEKYLIECLDSICNQTFNDYELILVDDGSPDQCPWICEQYAQKDERIKVVHKTNGGLVEARKTGIKLAKGKYTVFVDGDDWIDSGLLLEAKEIFQDKTVEIIAFDYYKNTLNEQEVCSYKIKPGYYAGIDKEQYVDKKMMCYDKYFEFGLAPSIATKIFRTELIKDMLEQADSRVTMGEDAMVTYPAILKANAIVISSKAYYHYRNVENSMSQLFNPQYFEKIELLLDWFDEKKFASLESQLILYKLMLFEIGIIRILLQDIKLSEAILQARQICNQEKYREPLNYITKDRLLEKNSLLISLKENRYKKIYLVYFLKRIKRKVKQLLRK